VVGSGVAARGSHAEPVEVVVPAEPSAVLALNRGVAVAMADGPATALPLLDTLVTDPALARSHRVWSVRADLLRRLGERQRAAADYDRALALVDKDVERRYLAAARAHLEES
jgi:RNA polymerase sigma-70 factor (ECF subfamily)